MQEPNDKFFKYISYLYLSFTCKHKLWKYENEYRILYESLSNKKDGELIDLSEVGLMIEFIYIGYECNEPNTSELVNIGMDIGCEVYKMDFDKYSGDFSLKSKRLY